MAANISRRAFHQALITGSLSAGAVAAAYSQAPTVQAPATQTPKPADAPEEIRDYPAPKFKPNIRKPRLSATLNQDFVIYAHSELDMVKLLLDKYPTVLNAVVDWGNGDFESGMGGASHLGRRDIVTYLIERGARPDIFTWAMLGRLDIVKPLITAHPTLADAKGPHGITLQTHAKMGGKEAEEVFKYLESIKKA